MALSKDHAARRSRRVAHGFLKPGYDLADVGRLLEGRDCDMVEIDVLARGRELVVAHSSHELDWPGVFTLDAALASLAEHLPPRIGVIVDLKRAGYERGVVDALRAHGLAERALISTMEAESLPVIRAAGPEVRLGWSVPKVRRDYLANPLTKPAAYAVLAGWRQLLPRQAAREIRAGRIDAIMAHWGMVSRRLAAAVRDAGGELYVWTVDDAARLSAMERLGVSGVITNDLRLFDGGRRL